MSSRRQSFGVLATLLLLSAALTASAALEIPNPDEPALGTVASAQTVNLEQRRRASGAQEGLKDILERHFELLHGVQSADELVVRLDDGREVSVIYYGMQRFFPGQRVRVICGVAGARVELV
jgi:hypothetical protein